MLEQSLSCSCCSELVVICVCHLQQLDSIRVTILHKEEGAGLGFSLAGGADLENKVITVSNAVMAELGGRLWGQTCWEGASCWGQKDARDHAPGQVSKTGSRRAAGTCSAWYSALILTLT